MSSINIYLESPAAAGMAVGEIWRAFAHTAFERQGFTAYYGPGTVAEPVILVVPGGDYWVQLKLSHGEMTTQLVNIPEVANLFKVVLQIPQPELSTSPALSVFSVEKSLAYETISEVRHLTAVATPLDTPARQGNTRRTRSVKAAALPIPVPVYEPSLFTLRRNVELAVPSDGATSADAPARLRLSVSRIAGKFMGWPRRPSSVASAAASGFIRPEDYFSSALKAPSLEPMSLVATESALVLEIATVAGLGTPRSQRDITEGRFTRDLVILKGNGNQVQLVVAIPNGWHGQTAQLRISANNGSDSATLRVSVEVKDRTSDALLQFMKSGDLNSAVRVIETSVDILYAKFTNPFAAAAAGYVLVQAAPDTIQVAWKSWIGNLGHYFGDLPDGQILHATLLLRRGDTQVQNAAGDEDEQGYFPAEGAARNNLAARLTLSAVGKGPPIYRLGLSLLATNLRILRSVDLPQDVRVSLDECEKLVTWLSMRVDPVEPFSVFRLRG